MSTALTLHQVDAPAVTTNNAALIKALAAACDEVKGVEKRGTNKEQGYKYQKAADVAMAFRHELFRRGIIVLQDETQPEFIQVGTTSKGGPVFECRIGIRYNIMGEGGHVVINGYGVGRDSGDKAIWKAKTGAVKYFLRGLGLIPDEKEDPEYDGGDKPDSRAEQGELAEDRHDAIRLGGIIKSEKESTDRQGKTFIWYQIETLTNEGQTTILVASPKDTDSGRLADKVGWLVDIEVVPNESVRAGVFTLVRVMNVRKPLGKSSVFPVYPEDQQPGEQPSKFEREMDAPPEAVAAPVSDDGTIRLDCHVADCQKRLTKAKKEYWQLTVDVEGAQQPLGIAVWDTKLFAGAQAILGKDAALGVKREEKGDRTYYSLMEIYS